MPIVTRHVNTANGEFIHTHTSATTFSLCQFVTCSGKVLFRNDLSALSSTKGLYKTGGSWKNGPRLAL